MFFLVIMLTINCDNTHQVALRLKIIHKDSNNMITFLLTFNNFNA
jgi:hypothetical protein